MTKKKIIIICIIILIVIVICFSIFFYRFNDNAWHNNASNSFAKVIYNSAAELIEKNPQIECDDMIISDDNSFDINSKEIKDEFLKKFDEYMSQKNHDSKKYPDYKKGVYYIEIRNGKVYKTIYARWRYSGYTGIFPDINISSRTYKKLAQESLNDFNKYLDEKKDSEKED